jgi:homoserine O-succinyltransferase
LESRALESAGYEILSGSAENGVDTFIKRRNSLLVFFQGHPEYEDQTLLKEFRRDVGRFLSGEQATYPRAPAGYFGETVQRVLDEFERRAIADRDAVSIHEFPYAAAAAAVENRWTGPAVAIYRNWLDWIGNKKQVATGR